MTVENLLLGANRLSDDGTSTEVELDSVTHPYTDDETPGLAVPPSTSDHVLMRPPSNHRFPRLVEALVIPVERDLKAW